MLLEAAIVLCLTNATDTAVSGLVRDGRFKTTSAKLEGTSLTYRAPLVETPFPAVDARQTGCANVEGLTPAKPQLVIHGGSVGGDRRRGDTICRPTRPLKAGERLTFVYRKSFFGPLTCKEIR
ncbi:hypothetical protein ASD21_21465 [Caulobacter sp. Root1455]|jgi:hypothetical protein|uniref:hypothetical protein n=1 Tax=unclassified Caulobacter TaxID=2648921 RepID=UPI0006FD751E|nr:MULTISPECIES: hypothetical protein [unclassified Caulobacter]KQY35007.1 hypothetical protein ASD38_00050 [Caulobacter sp. Root487D2Y]KQZ02884.1 hypothetical protein ASD21_21465 [Caulobacter sp. Root1455]